MNDADTHAVTASGHAILPNGLIGNLLDPIGNEPSAQSRRWWVRPGDDNERPR